MEARIVRSEPVELAIGGCLNRSSGLCEKLESGVIPLLAVMQGGDTPARSVRTFLLKPHDRRYVNSLRDTTLELNRALAESAEMKWTLVGNYPEAGGV